MQTDTKCCEIRDLQLITLKMYEGIVNCKMNECTRSPLHYIKNVHTMYKGIVISQTDNTFIYCMYICMYVYLTQ